MALLRTGKQVFDYLLSIPIKATLYVIRGVLRELLRYGQVQRAGVWLLKGHPDVKAKLLQLAGIQHVQSITADMPAAAVFRSSLKEKYWTARNKLTSKIKRNIQQSSNGKTLDKRPIYLWIDHTSKCPTSTGIQRVTRCLAKSLVQMNASIVFVCWNEERASLVKASKLELKRLSQFNGPEFSNGFLSMYEGCNDQSDALDTQVTPDEIRGAWLIVPEVTHITYHQKPPTADIISYAKKHGMKTAFIYYDSIPLILDEYKDARAAHAEYLEGMVKADIVMPISDYSAKFLSNYYCNTLCYPPEKQPVIKPVPLPGESCFNPRIKEYQFDQKELCILSVGTIEPRKNQITLIRAFENICKRHPEAKFRLILCGIVHKKLRRTLNMAMRRNPKIQHYNYVDDNKLADIYKQCAFTVFPSIGEGFGLPIIESLWHGKPVICANFGAMADTAIGGGCLTVDTRSVSELESAMEQMLFDEKLRSRLADEAISRPIKSWSEYRSDVLGTLNEFDNPVTAIKKIYYWVDHTCWYPANTGIQRVTRGLARELQRTGVGLIPIKWNYTTQTFHSPEGPELLHLSKWNGPGYDQFSPLAVPDNETNSWLLIPELITPMGGAPDLDLIIQKANTKGLKTAIIFYDAFPYKHTHIYPPDRAFAHGEYMKKVANCDCAFPISEASLADLRDFLIKNRYKDVDLNARLIALPLPGEFLERQRVTSYKEPSSSKIRILSVSTIEPRKNHVTLLKAFENVSHKIAEDIELIIVGDCPFPDLESIVNDYMARNSDIHWLKNIDDTALAAEYARCHFTVYPSLDEGFGLPILESCWYGRPCICRNSSAMVEAAAEGGCLTVDTADVDKLTDAILLLSTDKETRTRLGKESVTRHIKTWSEYTWEILHHLAERTSGCKG
jgi:glycosyltransferase involved in cell wall biosynthesis